MLRRCRLGLRRPPTLPLECDRCYLRGSLVSSRAWRVVPMSEHLPECSGPFCHTSIDKLVKLCGSRSSATPCARFRSKSASMFRDEITVFTKSVIEQSVLQGRTVLTLFPSSPKPTSNSSSSEHYLDLVPPTIWLHRDTPN